MTHTTPTLGNLPADVKDRLGEPCWDKQEFHNACMSLALACINRGWSEQDYERILEQTELYDSFDWGDRKLGYDIGKAWSHAEEVHDGRAVYAFGSDEGREGVRDILRDLTSSKLVQGLKRGPRATVLAVIGEGIRRGAWTLDLSNREIAEMTGTTHRTVGNHLHKAVDAGVLKLESAGPGHCQRIILETDPLRTFYNQERVSRNYPHNLSMGGDSIMWAKIEHPVFSSHGLGPIAGALYAALTQLDEPASVRKVATAAGCSASTAAKHLPRMLDAGLVVKRLDFSHPRYEAALSPDLDAIAELIGVGESVAAMQYRHDIERDLFVRARLNWVPGEAALPEDDNAELFELACRSGNLTPPDAGDSLAPEPVVPQDPEPDVQSELLDALVAGDYSDPQDPGPVYPEGWDDFTPAEPLADVFDPYVPEVEPAPIMDPCWWDDPFANIDRGERVEDPFARGAGDQPADPWEPVRRDTAPVDPFAACFPGEVEAVHHG